MKYQFLGTTCLFGLIYLLIYAPDFADPEGFLVQNLETIIILWVSAFAAMAMICIIIDRKRKKKQKKTASAAMEYAEQAATYQYGTKAKIELNKSEAKSILIGVLLVVLAIFTMPFSIMVVFAYFFWEKGKTSRNAQAEEQRCYEEEWQRQLFRNFGGNSVFYRTYFAWF